MPSSSQETRAPEPPDAIQPLSRAAWRAWLEKHHAQSRGVWLISYRRDAGQPRIEYEEAVEEALCFGWIDGKQVRLDERRSMLWFAPRRPGSWWAKSNRARVARLVEAGLMTPAGLAVVRAAQADGSWTALDALEDLEVPPDFAAALAAQPGAQGYWEAFPPSARRGILVWIRSAKRPGTRAKRVAEAARLAGQNIRANQRPSSGS